MEMVLRKKISNAAFLTLNNVSNSNAINYQLLKELNDGLSAYENDETIKAIILESSGDVFCAGMDFKEVFGGKEPPLNWIVEYKNTLKRLTEIGKLTIASVAGKVLAGGVGLVAACDVVIANQDASFKLPEVLWGLLPANVLPYLIRRVGFQAAYFMTVTIKTIDAKAAKEMQLVDILAEDIEETLHSLLKTWESVDHATLAAMKAYFRKLIPISDTTEKFAIDTLDQCIQSPVFQKNAKNFLEHKKFPWEK